MPDNENEAKYWMHWTCASMCLTVFGLKTESEKAGHENFKVNFMLDTRQQAMSS